MSILSWALRLAIFGLAAFVVYRLAPAVVTEWQKQNGCPKLGPIPACYLVSAAYIAIGLAALLAPRRLTWLFFLGWLPVFALAATGSTLELFGRTTCPATAAGTPMCYFSLAVSLLLLPVFLLARLYSRSIELR